MNIRRTNIAFALVTLLALGACSAQEDPVPARPDSVSASAAWVGGVDGGVFVDIEPAAAGEYRVRVYHANGETEVDAIFVPGAGTSPAGKITATSVSAWDGEQLLLDGGGVLVAKPGT